MSDTPRTDINVRNTPLVLNGQKFVTYEFAAQLERELSNMTKERDKWADRYVNLVGKV